MATTSRATVLAGQGTCRSGRPRRQHRRIARRRTSARQPHAASGRRSGGPAPAQRHHGTSSPAQVSSRARRTATASASAGTRAHSSTCSPEQGTCIDGGDAGGHSAAYGPRAHLALRVDGRRLGGRAHSVSSSAPTPAQRHRRSAVADGGDMGASGVAGSHPRGNCARLRGAPAPQAVTPVAVRVPDANDASHGDRCHLNGRPHRVDAAARDLHQRGGALGASFPPGSDAGGPSSPWRQHVRVTRRRPPRRRQRPPARAAYRLRTQRRQWVASQADDAHTCAPCADRRHSYSTARSLTRRGASMGPESAGLWRRATAAPLHATRRRPTAATSMAAPAARALLLHRTQQHQRMTDTTHGACIGGVHLGRNARGPERGTRRMQRPQWPWARMRPSCADGGRPNGSALPRAYSVPRATCRRSGLAAAPTREPAQDNQMKLFVVPTLRPHRRQD
jgi:hypothetical protein